MRITVEDFAETYKVSDRSTAYSALKEATERLYGRDIRTYDNLGRRHGRFRWVQSIEYHDGQGYVELVFTQHVAPYITLLHKKFTTYILRQISTVNSIYSIRLFELLMQFKRTGIVVIGVEELKLLFELEGKYDRFANLKVRVIEPAVQELRVKANLDISWEAMRRNRRVETLRFTFHENPQ